MDIQYITPQNGAIIKSFDGGSMRQPPPEIVQAAQKVEHWYASNNIPRWKLGGIQSVESRPTIVDNAIDPSRALVLERALEFAINFSDGLEYVHTGKVMIVPEMMAVRALLPYVCWKWKEYFVRPTYAKRPAAEKKPAGDWPEIFTADDDRLRPA